MAYEAAAARIRVHASRRRSVASPEIRKKVNFVLRKKLQDLRCHHYILVFWCYIVVMYICSYHGVINYHGVLCKISGHGI